MTTRCRTCQRVYSRGWRHRTSQASLNRRREYDRIWKEVQRRRAGIAPRPLTRRTTQAHRERVLIPAEPFADWLRDNVKDESVSRWARAHDIDESQVRKIRDGGQALVHIDTVDRVAVRARLHLSAIYPELYAEAVA